MRKMKKIGTSICMLLMTLTMLVQPEVVKAEPTTEVVATEQENGLFKTR